MEHWPRLGDCDSFTLAGSSTLTGATFTLWNVSGETTSQVDWSIFSNAAGHTIGSSLASGTGAAVSSTFASNFSGYDIYNDSITLPDTVLGAGTYWLELRNAVVSNSDAAFWDINGGPSKVWSDVFGDDPSPSIANITTVCNMSTTFAILGSGTPSTPGSVSCGSQPASVPEPAILILFGSGLAGLALLRRRKQRPIVLA